MENQEVKDLAERIEKLSRWLFESKCTVVFTGAGISTESGLRDFRGPDGLWTRRDKGLATPKQDFTGAEPNSGHYAILEIQKLGRLAFENSKKKILEAIDKRKA